MCAALRLGWVTAAKSALTSRILQKQQSARVRRIAQAHAQHGVGDGGNRGEGEHAHRVE